MKIIEDRSKSFKYTCRHCHSILEVDKNDIVGDPDIGNGLSITCPCCGKCSEVLWLQIPKRVQELFMP